MELNFKYIFAGSFDTFKVFKDLTAEEAGRETKTGLKTIWQTLNHLILWQEQQLKSISQEFKVRGFQEHDTWINEAQPSGQQELEKAIETFKKQTEQFKQEINMLKITDSFSGLKIKVIQEASSHLSFHLGEMIFLRRSSGSYPLPDQMKKFLMED